MKVAPMVTAAAPPANVGEAQDANQSNDPDRSFLSSQTSQTEQRSIIGSMLEGADTQGRIWNRVGDLQASLSANLGAEVKAEDSETSLQLALENKKLAEAQARYIDVLQPVAEKDADVVGFAFAINGKLNSADIYASNALFSKLWPRLLKASVTEALGAASAVPKNLTPDIKSVDAFLTTAAAGKPSEQPLVDGLRVETREAEAVIDFETVRKSGEMIHRNVLARH
jgi:hypothetical protein